MKWYLVILFIFLIGWLGIYISKKYYIINRERIEIDNLFLELDNLFSKRIDILLEMIDIIKVYAKFEYEGLFNNLRDKIDNYGEYDLSERLMINENLSLCIRKVFLVSSAYPDILKIKRYVKLENYLRRLNKKIGHIQKNYNNLVIAYLDKKKSFPYSLICKIGKFYQYNYFNISDGI